MSVSFNANVRAAMMLTLLCCLASSSSSAAGPPPLDQRQQETPPPPAPRRGGPGGGGGKKKGGFQRDFAYPKTKLLDHRTTKSSLPSKNTSLQANPPPPTTPRKTQKDEDDDADHTAPSSSSSFHAFVLAEVMGTPRLVTTDDYNRIQNAFVATYEQLTKEEEERCAGNADHASYYYVKPLLDNVVLLPETTDAFGDKTLGDPDVGPVDYSLNFTYVMEVQGRSSNPCSLSPFGTGVPNLFEQQEEGAGAADGAGEDDDCSCTKSPSAVAFVDLFNEFYLSSIPSEGIVRALSFTQTDFVPDCDIQELSYFETTVLVTASSEFLENDANVIEQRFMETYNQANFLNDNQICDPLRRIVVGVSVQLPDENCTDFDSDNQHKEAEDEEQEEDDDKKQDHHSNFEKDDENRRLQEENDVLMPSGAPSTSSSPSPAPSIRVAGSLIEPVEFFMTVTGTCIGCNSDTNLFDAVDLRRRGRRKLEQYDHSGFQEYPTARCLCPFGLEHRGPTVEEFLAIFAPGLCVLELDPVECPDLEVSVSEDDNFDETTSSSADNEEYEYHRSKLDTTLTLNASSWSSLLHYGSSLVADEGQTYKKTGKKDEDTKNKDHDEGHHKKEEEVHPTIQVLQDLFVQAYNSLIAEFCDYFGRVVVFAAVLDPNDVLRDIERKVKKQELEDKVDLDDVKIDVRFLVVRRCRRGIVDGTDIKQCDGLFADTITDALMDEVSEDRRFLRRARNSPQNGSDNPRDTSQDGAPNEVTILNNGQEDSTEQETFVVPSRITAWSSRMFLPDDSSTTMVVKKATTLSSSVQRRGLLVSPPACNIAQCFCPTDAVKRRPPKRDEFLAVYEDFLEFAASSQGGNGTHPFMVPGKNETSFFSFTPLDPVTSVSGLCPWTPNPEPNYTVVPTLAPTFFDSEFPSEYPSSFDEEESTDDDPEPCISEPTPEPSESFDMSMKKLTYMPPLP